MRHKELGSLKLFGFLHRRRDLSLDAFRTHWRTTHAQEALKLARFFTAYVQNHSNDDDLPGFRRACDGAPELWFDDPGKAAAMNESDEYLTGAYVDEPKFMEGRASGVVTRDVSHGENPPLSLSEPSVKALVFAKRVPDSDFPSFEDWYEQHQGPLVALAKPPHRFLRAIAVVPPHGTPPPLFDAVEEYWWPTMEAFEDAWGRGVLTENAASKVDQAQCTGLLSEEVRIAWPNEGITFP